MMQEQNELRAGTEPEASPELYADSAGARTATSMNIVDALARERTDSMTVSRAVAGASGYGAVRESLSVVYENAPCRLAFSSLSGLSRTGAAVPGFGEALTDMRTVLTLFHGNEYEIRRNDRVRVTRQGRVYEGIAGQSCVYPSHTQTALAVRGR